MQLFAWHTFSIPLSPCYLYDIHYATLLYNYQLLLMLGLLCGALLLCIWWAASCMLCRDSDCKRTGSIYYVMYGLNTQSRRAMSRLQTAALRCLWQYY
jgi:hypothetical protein